MQQAASRRITGVDTARGLAVLGMFVAHLGMERHSDFLSPTGWFILADGRPSALFATLAGIGLVFMTRRAQDDPAQLRAQRIRILKRSGILFVLGYLLMFFGTPVAVILAAYAVLFVLALPFLTLRAPLVFGIAAMVFALSPQLLILTRYAVYGAADPRGPWAAIPGVAEVWGGYYPAITWLGYILIGIGIGKLNLRSRSVATALVGGGAAVAAAAYGIGWWAEGVVTSERTFDLVTIAPHANTTPEMVGNAGFAAATLGLCLLANSGRVGQAILMPISAVGAMSLTIYSLHIVYIAILGTDAVWYPTSNWPLIWLVLGSIAFAVLWQRLLGQGPMERGIRRAIAGRTRSSRPGSGPPPYGNHPGAFQQQPVQHPAPHQYQGAPQHQPPVPQHQAPPQYQGTPQHQPPPPQYRPPPPPPR